MQATAVIVCDLGLGGGRIWDVAERVGFTTIMPYAGLASAERHSARTPLIFFLFDSVSDVLSLEPVVNAIRFSGSRVLRFSPLIYFDTSPSLESIQHCVRMGFDDIIAAPFRADRITTRLHRQLGRPLTYYESASYLGPDRQRGLPVVLGDGSCRRLQITRSAMTGSRILGEEAGVAP